MEYLSAAGFDRVLPEYTYGSSRIDFYLEKGDEKTLMEVKGCTLERNGTGYFPDAPTERGIKHIHELIRAKKEGYRAVLAFVIQMEGINEVRPNTETHPQFGTAWDEAVSAGVDIVFFLCSIKEDEILITDHIRKKENEG